MQHADVCPYCLGTDPHQGPTGCPPIVWPPADRPLARLALAITDAALAEYRAARVTEDEIAAALDPTRPRAPSPYEDDYPAGVIRRALRRVHTCPQGPLCAAAEMMLDHDCAIAAFLDDPITIATGTGPELVSLIACDVCTALESAPTWWGCNHGSCGAIVNEPCRACFAETMAGE